MLSAEASEPHYEKESVLETNTNFRFPEQEDHDACEEDDDLDLAGSGLPAYQQLHQEQYHYNNQSDSMSVISTTSTRRPLPRLPPPIPPPLPSVEIAATPSAFRAELLRRNIPADEFRRPSHGKRRDSTATAVTARSEVSAFRKKDRDLYYNIFEDHTRIRVNHPCDPQDPYLARISTAHLHPPRTISVMKRHIANKEAIDPSHMSSVYLTPDDDEPLLDTVKLMNTIEEGHGSSSDNPIIIMIDRKVIGEPLLLQPLSYETHTEEPDAGCLVACGLFGSRKSSLTLRKSNISRGKVASSERPMGWLKANIAAPCALHTLKVNKGGAKQIWGRAVGDKIAAEAIVYVDPRNVTWDGDRVYRVINPESRDIGYCKRAYLKFDAANEIAE